MNHAAHTNSGNDDAIHPLISVIIPMFNKEQYVLDCVHSVIAQTYHAIEILIIDDGSTDSSPQIISELANSDSRIRIITQSNQGVSAARNQGIYKSRGTYLLFIDADDWIDANTIEQALHHITTHDCDAVRFGIILEQGSRTSPRPLPWHDKTIDSVDMYSALFSRFDGSLYSANTLLIKRDYLLKTNITFQEGLSHFEDILLNAQLYGSGCRTRCIANNLYHYRSVKSSSSNTYSPRLIESANTLWEAVEELEAHSDIARQGADSFTEYARWLYVLCIAQYVESQSDAGVVDSRVIDKLVENGHMHEAFSEKRSVQYKPLIASIAYRLIANKQYRLLAIYLKTLNIARTVRRRVR